MIKPALMNQKLIAGIGNLYADEILFQAGVHPETRADELSNADFGRLFRVMRRVLRIASDRLADVDRFPRGYLLPRRGEGEPCPACGRDMERVTVSGRTSVFCPGCQRR